METVDAATLMTCAKMASTVGSTQLILSSIVAGVTAIILVLTMIFPPTFHSDYVSLDVNKGVMSQTAPIFHLCTHFLFWTYFPTSPSYGKYWLHKHFCHVLLVSIAFHCLPVSSLTF